MDYGFNSNGGILIEEVMCPNLHFERHSLTSGFRTASGAELEWKQGFQITGYDHNPTKRQEAEVLRNGQIYFEDGILKVEPTR